MISQKAFESLQRFQQLLNKYRRWIAEKPRQLSQHVLSLIREIDYDAEIKKQYKQPDQQKQRRVIVEQFISSLAQYVERSDKPSLHGYLEETALFDRLDQNQDDKDQGGSVRLMTLHSAKGLEFPRVYLVGLEEGLLPHRRSVELGTDAAIAEERRLAYVGITRAMEVLTITRAAARTKWGKKRPTIPSRFLFEMKEGYEVEPEVSSTRE